MRSWGSELTQFFISTEYYLTLVTEAVSRFPLTSELVPFFVSKHNLHLLILKLRIFLLSIEIFLTFKERNPHWDKNNAIHSSFNLLRKMTYSEIFAKKIKKKKRKLEIKFQN